MKADVSVVVCTYNRADRLRCALESLVRQETHGQFTFEIVAVDDGSTDRTQAVLRNAAEASHVPIRSIGGEGKGIAAARNTGVEAASGEWIAFFDDDQVAERDWLRELYALALNTGSHCVGGARLLLLTARDLSRLSPACRAGLGEITQGNEPRKCRRKEFPAAGNMLLRRAVFDRVGMFDDSLIRGGEDIEFAVRLRRAGIEPWFTPKAVVHHYVPRYRLGESYLFWCSLRAGDNFAHRDFREWGLTRTLLACMARIGQGLLVNFPLLVLAYVRGNRAHALARKCLLVRAWGYLRESLYLVSPRLFPQEAHFSRLAFRTERSSFAGS
jgi:glycosyltransferase involved in cell wall biosynthesis